MLFCRPGKFGQVNIFTHDGFFIGGGLRLIFPTS
jgi:hypothetical protein